MKNMDAMYICTTPFQIMSAISLAVNRKEAADLYIDAQFEGAEDLAEKIRQRKIFDTVRVLKNISCIDQVRGASGKVQRYNKIISLYRHIEDAAAQLLLPDRRYRILYATHNVFVANLLMLYISKKDIRTKVYFFDDGEGSYDNRDIFKISLPDKLTKRLVLGRKAMRGPRRLYMYSPDLFNNMHPTNRTPVYHLPQFRENETVLEHIKAVFEVSPEKGIREPVIILDSLKEVVLSPEDDARIVKLYDRLQAEFGEDRVILKQHPRDTRTYETPIREYPFTRLPFEITCLASDPSKMTLITLLSTATIMPKLLMDEEPRIVLLYHMFKRLEGNDADRDRFFELVKKTYNDPGRIVIPDTDEELDELIRTIREELNS